MNDVNLISGALQRTPAEATALATVVAVEGSTCRRPGGLVRDAPGPIHARSGE